jgi:serine/threonine protein kinase
MSTAVRTKIMDDKYILMKTLFEKKKDDGTFSTKILLVKDTTDNKLYILKLSVRTYSNSDNPIKELSLFNKINNRCQYIINLIEYIIKGNLIVFKLEYANYGDVFEYIKKKRSLNILVPNNQIFNILTGILKGVSFLHTNNICHLDLSPENILLYYQNKKLHVKITDFGLANEIKKDHYYGIRGKKAYMAPEIGYGIYDGKKADVWSIGCILLFIIIRGTVFTSPLDKSVNIFIKEKEKGFIRLFKKYKIKCHPVLLKLLTMMICDVKERSSVDEILNYLDKHYYNKK